MDAQADLAVLFTSLRSARGVSMIVTRLEYPIIVKDERTTFLP